VVAGDAELIADMPSVAVERSVRGGGYARGFEFLGNLLDWTAGSGELLELRSRQDKPRVIEPVEGGKQKLIQYGNLLGIPLLVICAGVIVFLVRKYQR
jgi:hypothetical protein